MVYLSVLSFNAAIMYFFVGFNAFKSNKKSELCRTFFYLTLSMTIWSFAWGFLYLAENSVEYSFWNKISAFGWCTFEALVMYFVMILTRNNHIRYWYVKLMILMPAPVFLYMVLFLFGPNIDTNPIVESIFYIGNFLYNFTYLAISILLVFLWGQKSKSRIQKKQANIIAICSVIPFLLNLFLQNILPILGLIKLPNMGHIFTLIMLLGVNYAIIRYQFMSIPTALITNELFNELTGLTFLVDSQGFIIKANRQVYTLLDYSEDDIIGKHINNIIQHEEICDAMERSESAHTLTRFQDINISSKAGMSIPFNISIIPLRSKSDLLLGILIIGEDIRVTKWLQDEIVKHMLTNEKLQNSEETLKQNNENIKKLNKELLIMNNILVNKSIKDGLTNLFNYQYMRDVLETNIQETTKTKENLCVMMLDIDSFKRVNDKYGHQIGDKVLVTVADLIMKNTRGSDYIGRYGGEEFIVVLPNTNIGVATMIAERIRVSIQDYDFGLEELKVTISIGVVQYINEMPTALVNKADMLLYQAKHYGKNRVEYCLDEMPVA